MYAERVLTINSIRSKLSISIFNERVARYACRQEQKTALSFESASATSKKVYKQTSKQELVYTKKENLFQIGARKVLRRFSDDFLLLGIAQALQTMQIFILCIKLYAVLVIVIL